MPSYELTLEAETDLREIVRYTTERWGEKQTRIYVQALQRCAEAIATGQGLFQDVSALYEGLRIVHCEHHYIFCLPRPDAPALIVAIFHERMELIERVKNRLG